jgi:nicotinamide riboside transporter PnuC
MADYQPKHAIQTTQVAHPWRTTVRTILQALVGLAAMAPAVYSALTGSSPEQAVGWAATALAITGAATRLMALPGVEAWLQHFIPWLAAGTAEHTED